MTILTPVQGDIIVGIVTICWGIFVEKWYAGKWTIFFNIISLIVIVATINIPSEFLYVLGIYLLVSLLALTKVLNYEGLKQVVGAKSFGSFTVIAGLMEMGQIPLHWALLTGSWIALSAIVYGAWKKNKGQ